MNSLYREEILEHWKNPQNFGEITNADFVIDDHNPLCGDSIHLTGKMAQGKMIDIKFTGEGCVISKAAASILTEFVKERTLKEIRRLETRDFLDLLGISLTISRIKCALLPLSALHKAIRKVG